MIFEKVGGGKGKKSSREHDPSSEYRRLARTSIRLIPKPKSFITHCRAYMRLALSPGGIDRLSHEAEVQGLPTAASRLALELRLRVGCCICGK